MGVLKARLPQSGFGPGTVSKMGAESEPEVEVPSGEPVRRRAARTMTRVAAGHLGGVLQDMGDISDEEEQEEPTGTQSLASPKKPAPWILKQLDDVELTAYTDLNADKDDPMHEFIPKFAGEAEVRLQRGDNSEKNYPPGRYIRLSNVLLEFSQPFVMDVKMGVRSFLEKECKSAKLRDDLYRRMLEINAQEPTPEEREREAITKHRWMSFRDNLSSSVQLGFRIDGMAGPGHLKLRADAFTTLREKDEVVQELLGFLPPAPRRFRKMMRASLRELGETDSEWTPIADDLQVLNTKIRLAKDILEQLRRILSGCERSRYFQGHEFVGTSLLFVADQSPPMAKVFMIDFAKTLSVPDGVSINHRRPWELGNHEDGFLFGLDNLISCWEEVLILLSKEAGIRPGDVFKEAKSGNLGQIEEVTVQSRCKLFCF